MGCSKRVFSGECVWDYSLSDKSDKWWNIVQCLLPLEANTTAGASHANIKKQKTKLDLNST